MPLKTREQRATYMRDYRARKKDAVPKPQEARRAAPGTPVGEEVAEWAEEVLRVPTGPLRGQSFHIPDWQRQFLVEALGPGVREAGLSVARKNGKSGLIAGLLLAYLVGPLNTPQWRGVVVSLTGALAAELRDAVVQTAEASGLDDLLQVRRSPPPGSITGLNGARLTILASDRATGHAIGSDLAIVDEAGLIQEAQRELWNAVLSSTSGRDGRLLCISIRGDGPMFGEMAARAGQPGVVWHEYAAPEGCALDDEAAWIVANPGLVNGIKSHSYMIDASRRAIATPADASAFRAYDLNQPQSPSRELLCDVSDWLKIECHPEDLPPRKGECVVGFDIGGSSSLCAFTALWPRTGRMEAQVGIGDNPSLLERGRADGVGALYVQMQERGELTVYPGRVTPVADFLRDCAARLAGVTVTVAGADRYRRAEVEDVLTITGLTWPIEWRGQGASATADGSHDVRALQRMILGGKLRVAESLCLRSAIAESSIRYDSSGNPALDKARSRSRIDALQAAVIAAGLGEMVAARPPRRRARVTLV